ncbi:MAG: replication initiator protein A [Rubrobacter sp.]|nr:replication initiator protein A [Rubrobacter sp.]MDQ3302105.1 replication initiator protein A [Actinomycetota bacterium]
MSEDRLDLTLFPQYSMLVSAERNLEEYPLFELKARQRGSKARVFERTIEGEDGVALRQTWKVIPSGEYGMPGPVDQDIYLAVLQLLEQRGGMSEDGELAFSLYEIRKVLGWSDDSASAYRQIRDALIRIQLTGVQSSNAFYSAADEQLIADSFNVWSVHFAQRRKRNSRGGARPQAGGQDRHVLRFHPIFIRNYMAQYLKGLDADFYWSLRLPLSKRLYRLVDLQRAGGLSWKTDLLEVRDQVPLDYAYPSQVKRALERAHAELVERAFLSGVDYEGKTGVLYRVSPGFARRQKALELSGDPQEMFAIERLIREGVRGDTARELVLNHGAGNCLHCADALDAQKGIRNRASFLVSAIREGYDLPAPPPDQESLELSLIEGPPAQEASDVHTPVRPASDAEAERVWQEALDEVSENVDSPSLQVWFEGAVPVALRHDVLTVSVPNNVAQEYIERRFSSSLEEALRPILGQDARLELECYT